MYVCKQVNVLLQCTRIYRIMAKNFGRKIFWRIAKNMSFGGIHFGGSASLSHNNFAIMMPSHCDVFCGLL